MGLIIPLDPEIFGVFFVKPSGLGVLSKDSRLIWSVTDPNKDGGTILWFISPRPPFFPKKKPLSYFKDQINKQVSLGYSDWYPIIGTINSANMGIRPVIITSMPNGLRILL